MNDLNESLKRNVSPEQAHHFLTKLGARNKNFFTLNSGQVSDLVDHGTANKYRKGAHAPGSYGRMYHDALERHANRHIKEEVESIDEVVENLILEYMENHGLDDIDASDYDNIVEMYYLEESKSHGNMNNGSPRGEGLSPSAKREKARRSEDPEFADETKTTKKSFDAFAKSGKRAKKRTNDKSDGDRTVVKPVEDITKKAGYMEAFEAELIEYMVENEITDLNTIEDSVFDEIALRVSHDE
jgi:hypothetical protein